jgi:hypothetical protein
MAHLILGEIRRYTVLLQVTHATVPKGVHTARHDPDALAERFQNPSANALFLIPLPSELLPLP